MAILTRPAPRGAGARRPASRARAPRPPALGTLGWTLLGVALVSLLLPLAVIEPTLPVLAAGGLVLLGLAFYRPRVFALIALLTIVLSVPLQSLLGPVGRNADEIVIMLCVVAFTVRRFVTERRLVWFPGWPFFLLFVLAGLVSAYVRDVPSSVAIEGMLLAVKGLLFAFALAQVEWREGDLRTLVRWGIGAIIVLVLCAIGNIAAPVPWATTFSGRPPVDYYGGIPSLSGPFQHPAAFGRFCAVLAIAVFVYRFTVRSSFGNTVLLVLTGAMALLTFRVKSLVGLIVSLGLLGLRFAKPVLIFAAICLGPVIALFVVPPILEFVGADVETYIVSDSARSTLTYGSLDVAAAYFPFGAGFGRYGSFTASVNYSPEYVMRGFEHVYGLGREDKGQFLNDTQWPAIWGETGWLGAAAFAIGIVLVFVALMRPTSTDEAPLVRWLRLSGIGWLVLILVESIAAPVFGSAPAYPFAFAAAGVVAAIRHAHAQAGATTTGGDASAPPGPDEGAAAVPTAAGAA
ncbi:hypothetical protein ACGGZK_01920 [Agromyces sp. MMS24-K17]|uniref:hypothetical protein n=1 Tax=Agromyces sp. MMS24-K17 TaxID=3372850 RepID=UPI0037545654